MVTFTNNWLINESDNQILNRTDSPKFSRLTIKCIFSKQVLCEWNCSGQLLSRASNVFMYYLGNRNVDRSKMADTSTSLGQSNGVSTVCIDILDIWLK